MGEEASRTGWRVGDRVGGEVLIEGLGIFERTLRMMPMAGEVGIEDGCGDGGCSVAGLGEGMLVDEMSEISWTLRDFGLSPSGTESRVFGGECSQRRLLFLPCMNNSGFGSSAPKDGENARRA